MIAISRSIQGLDELRALARADDPAAAGRVAREFEAMMLAEMLRFGAKPVFGENPLDGGSAGRMAREQLFSQLAVIASRGEGFGLARQLEVEMSKDGEAP